MEFFADTDRADLYAEAIDAVERLIVPVVTIYEVVKKLARDADERTAEAALALMQRGQLIEIDLPLALDAATNGLPLADSLIYASVLRHHAVLWTQDAHFEGLRQVRYFEKH